MLLRRFAAGLPSFVLIGVIAPLAAPRDPPSDVGSSAAPEAPLREEVAPDVAPESATPASRVVRLSFVDDRTGLPLSGVAESERAERPRSDEAGLLEFDWAGDWKERYFTREGYLHTRVLETELDAHCARSADPFVVPLVPYVDFEIELDAGDAVAEWEKVILISRRVRDAGHATRLGRRIRVEEHVGLMCGFGQEYDEYERQEQQRKDGIRGEPVGATRWKFLEVPFRADLHWLTLVPDMGEVQIDLRPQLADPTLPLDGKIPAGGASLAGRVQADGVVAAGTAAFRQGPMTVFTKLDEQGRYRLEGLPAGWGEAIVHTRGGLLRSQPVQLAEGAPAECDWELRTEPGIAAGELRDEWDRPLAHSSIAIWRYVPERRPAPFERVAQVTTDARGRFLVETGAALGEPLMLSPPDADHPHSDGVNSGREDQVAYLRQGE